MDSQFQRVAHRGGGRLAPENSLAAFRNALTLPVDLIELDVQMSHDGQLVVFHDATVDRLSEGTGNLLDLDFAALRTLNIAAHFEGGWPQVEHIPTLAEVLALVKKSRMQVCIELKLAERAGKYIRYPHIAEAVVREVKAAKMVKRVLLISFDWQTLSRLHYLEPSLVTGALISRDLWQPEDDPELVSLCRQVTSLGCNWMNMDVALFSASMVPLIHQNGFKIGLWTVNTLDDLRFLASTGVDSLTTDRPDLFSQM